MEGRIEMKRCCVCKKKKPESDFGRHAKTRELTASCSACMSKSDAERDARINKRNRKPLDQYVQDCMRVVDFVETKQDH
jgi:hypothetical protein